MKLFHKHRWGKWSRYNMVTVTPGLNTSRIEQSGQVRECSKCSKREFMATGIRRLVQESFEVL